MERNIRFYQTWVLRSDLEVVSSLCTTTTPVAKENSTLKRDPIIPPTIRSVQPLNSIASRHIKDSFVVPDGFDDEDVDDGPLLGKQNATHGNNMPGGKNQIDLSLRVTSRTIFQRTFIEDSHIGSSSDQQEDSTNISKTMTQMLDTITKCVVEGKQKDNLKISTL